MEARKVQEIFNSTIIKNIEIEILSTQHEVEKRHFEIGGTSNMKLARRLSSAYWAQESIC